MGVPDSGIFALQNLFSASFQSARVSSPYTLALAAGLFFLRFTQVDSPLRFSRHLCLSGWPDGHLSCRFITADPSHWLKVTYTMVLFVDEEVEPGSSLLQVHHYRLEDILRDRTFADLVSEDSQGRRRVDVGALDRTRPIT